MKNLVQKMSETPAFRSLQVPQMKTGLGSMEADLIVLMKKYLEIVGLVVFVWLLGKNIFGCCSSANRSILSFGFRLFPLQCVVDFTRCFCLSISSTSTYFVQGETQNAR